MLASPKENYPLDPNIVSALNLNRGGFKVCTYQEAMDTGYTCGAHVFLWASTERMVLRKYRSTAAILAILRHDGFIGFPGGLVDPGEVPAEAATREMKEELNVDISRFRVERSNLLISLVNHVKRFCCHFFCLKVTEEELLTIERGVIGCKEHGSETMGIMRVPVHTMADGSRGLPTFLMQKFVGSAREQLVYSLARLGILDLPNIKAAMERVP